MRSQAALAAAAAAVAVLAGCTGSSGDSSTGKTDGAAAGVDTGCGRRVPTAEVGLRILAGSEVKDLCGVLEQARKATGVTVALSLSGTLDGAERVAAGDTAAFDATWFSSNRYLSLLPGTKGKVTQQEKTMASPVVLGMREAKARELGWDAKAPTWAEIAAAAAARRFTYGMTNPSASNSGFSALVGVATALSGTGAALDDAQVKAATPQLRAFFAAQTMTAGSSGYLADAFTASLKGSKAAGGPAARADAMVNYESVVLDVNARATAGERLSLVYPADGVVTADYPLTLLTAAQSRRPAYDKLVGWLRSPPGQQAVMATHRRPVVPGTALGAEFGKQVLVELPFPSRVQVVDDLISTYLDQIRKPAQTLFILDVSSSMAQDDRIGDLQSALTALAGGDTTTTGRFARFRAREKVVMLPFSSEPKPPTDFTVPGSGSRDAVFAEISSYARELRPGGGTAIFASLVEAYRIAGEMVRANPDAYTSIVLMTDGENTGGIGVSDFERAYAALAPEVRAVPTFPVLFGGASPAELKRIAAVTQGKDPGNPATPGKLFEAKSVSLAQAFKEIRGYQ